MVSQLVFGYSVLWLNLDLAHYANRCDFDGTVYGVRQLNPAPTYIFLGSSLFRYLIWQLNETVNSPILNQALTKSKSRSVGASNQNACSSSRDTKSCASEQPHVLVAAENSLGANYSFALAGAMMSDFNFIFQKYVPRNIANDVVFVECSPRSFYDSGIQPTTTPVFRYFCDPSDVLQPKSDFFTNDSERFKWLINSLMPMSRYRHDIQELICDTANGVLEGIEHLRLKPAQTKRSFVSKKNVFAHSIAEYQGRYAGINQADVDIQIEHLRKLTQGIHRRKALPVLVVMPLTTENLQLLPANFYNEWHTSIVTLANEQNCRLFDFSTGAFTNADFYDSAHLNQRGGDKFLHMLGRT